MNKRCSLEACFDPEVVGCKIGEMKIERCPHWYANAESVATESPSAKVEDGIRFPWTGNALGAADLTFLSGHARTRLVAIMGAEAAGKTSLLAAWYSFAGSLTLEGWENIAASLRWSSPQGPAFPAHTASGTGRQPGLLHLAISNSGTKSQLLFADAPGEWFARWAVNRDAPDAAGAAWLASLSDVVLVVADSSALAGERCGVARASLFELLRRVGHERAGKPTALIWSKSDVNPSKEMVEAVKNMADRNLVEYKSFSISIHPSEGSEQSDGGYGLAELLSWVVSVTEQALPVPVATSPGRDLLKIFKRG
jgi:hypothetical protein